MFDIAKRLPYGGAHEETSIGASLPQGGYHRHKDHPGDQGRGRRSCASGAPICLPMDRGVDPQCTFHRKAQVTMPSHVYVMQRPDGLVKIGRSRSVQARIKSLSTRTSKVALVWLTAKRQDAADVEFTAQNLIRVSWVFGEWFSVAPATAVSAVCRAIDLVGSGDMSERHRLPCVYRRTAPPKCGPLAVRLSPDVREALERAALADSRKLSSLIAKIVSEWAKLGTKPGARAAGMSTPGFIKAVKRARERQYG